MRPTNLIRRAIAALIFIVVALSVPKPALGYSVLSHEANIDALWDTAIEPLLAQRFPRATADEVAAARAYAYGGSVIQDLGYYPFGSHLFSNLLHYVRTGDFVETLIAEARDINEYAFSLGALAHYAADNTGHPEAVNRAVPMMYPKLRAKYGDAVTYVQAPKNHVLVEFSFDVLQVAAGAYAPAAYHNFIGFEVAKPVLERAFLATYGLEMKDLFFDEDLAIGTYRFAVSQAIPNMTKVAWRHKRDEIEKLTPGARETQVVFRVSRQDFEKKYGKQYKKPGLLVRVLAFLYKLVPRIGPFKYLSFKPPTPEAEKLFLDSITQTRDRFRHSLDALRAGRLNLANTDFDTGKPAARGEYSLADETYDELLEKLADRKFTGVPDALRKNITQYFAAGTLPPSRTKKERKRDEESRRSLAQLIAASTTPPGR